MQPTEQARIEAEAARAGLSVEAYREQQLSAVLPHVEAKIRQVTDDFLRIQASSNGKASTISEFYNYLVHNEQDWGRENIALLAAGAIAMIANGSGPSAGEER